MNVGRTLSIKYIMEGNNKKALVVLKQMLAEVPGMYDAHVNLSHVYKNMGDVSKAEDELNKAIRLNPKLPEAYYNLGNLNASRGRYKEALEDYESAARIYKVQSHKIPQLFYKDKAIAHNRAGVQLIQEGKIQEAAGELEKALALDPSRLDARFNLGRLYLEEFKDKEKAKTQLELALALNPNPGQKEIIVQMLAGVDP